MVTAGTNSFLQEKVMAALAEIPDPEMPISIVDLGLVETADVVQDDSSVTARIRILPTFVGCPALDMIADDIRAGLSAIDGIDDVDVDFIFDPPWSVDRINDRGRDTLRGHGITVPERGTVGRLTSPTGQNVEIRISAVPCPYCSSRKTRLESPFGPARCRTIYYCDACRNQFEHLKRV